MIIGLFSFNMMVLLLTSLGVFMFNNHLKKISKGIDISLDPKAYKPQNKIKFISLLGEKYQDYERKSLEGIDVLLKDYFYSYKIGRFKPLAVERLAKKGKGLLWASILTMTLFEMMTIGLGQSLENSIMIIISAVLGIVLALFEMFIDIEAEKEKLFLKIENYLINAYPLARLKQKDKEKVVQLYRKIDKLEAQIQEDQKEEIEAKPKQVGQGGLVEDDIADILMNFSYINYKKM